MQISSPCCRLVAFLSVSLILLRSTYVNYEVPRSHAMVTWTVLKFVSPSIVNRELQNYGELTANVNVLIFTTLMIIYDIYHLVCKPFMIQ